jgi:aspartate/methionine/tyrosine aminotransferase
MASVAESALRVPHSRVRELAEIAMRREREGLPVHKLYFGESNLPTPEFIQRAAVKALRDGHTFYTSNAGLFPLREQLSRYYDRHHKVSLDPETEIVVTASGVQALSLAIRCTLDPGDEAIVLTPAWPNGSAIVEMSNAVVRQYAQPLIGDRYGIDFEALEAMVTPRTRMLLYTSPSNPLGWVATSDEQDRLLDLARRRNLWLMADEVYERLYYPADQPLGTPVPSILRKATREDAVIVVQSFSKSYCMTGWRLGWIVARKDLAQRAAQLNEFMVSCPVHFVQKAAEAALEWGEDAIREFLVQLKDNRNLCLRVLNSTPGVTVPQPDGAFYLFPKVKGMTDSFRFCADLLEETGVGLAPGVAFGAGGEGSVRLCYASAPSTLSAALATLQNYIRRSLC